MEFGAQKMWNSDTKKGRFGPKKVELGVLQEGQSGSNGPQRERTIELRGVVEDMAAFGPPRGPERLQPGNNHRGYPGRERRGPEVTIEPGGESFGITELAVLRAG